MRFSPEFLNQVLDDINKTFDKLFNNKYNKH